MSASTLTIAPSNGRGLQLTSIDDVMRFARIVITSGLAPKSFDTPEKVVIALVTGMELGISAMQSLQGLAVTNGRIGVMGDLALALCQASPDFEDIRKSGLAPKGRTTGVAGSRSSAGLNRPRLDSSRFTTPKRPGCGKSGAKMGQPRPGSPTRSACCATVRLALS